jgi:hypothetical protein
MSVLVPRHHINYDLMKDRVSKKGSTTTLISEVRLENVLKKKYQ